jgi:hypothetical protein
MKSQPSSLDSVSAQTPAARQSKIATGIYRVAPAAGSKAEAAPVKLAVLTAVREVGGRKDGTDPTRFGDWEKGGRCVDF